jgi:parallel beta-helix repeat protein
MMSRLLPIVLLVLLVGGRCHAAGTVFTVSPSGKDTWSGRLAAPNAAKTDGPFATVTRARDAIRKLKAKGALTGPVTVQLRAGNYWLDQTLSLGLKDGGTKDAPISWVAYEGEQPQIIGGRTITGLQPAGGGKWSVTLPQVAAGRWSFKSLFVDNQRMIRARYPNYDASDPYRKGFLYTAKDPSSFGIAVGCIHNVGDWMEYEVKVPATGDYNFWLFYASFNIEIDRLAMSDRTILKVDGGEAIPVGGLPDTGGWGVFKWGCGAKLKLTEGTHVLRWENVKSGGLGLDAYVLTDDLNFKPVDTKLPPVAAGKHRVMIQSENFTKYNGQQLSVGGSDSGAKDAFYYAPGEFKPQWAQAPGAEVHIFQTGNCRAFKEIAAIAAVDAEQRRVTMSGPELSSALIPGDRYFVENLATEADAPGEWYLDTKTGVLTLMPPPGFSAKSEVMAPTVERVIEVVGGDKPKEAVGNLTFSGLTIRGGEWNRADGVIGYGMGNNGVLFLKNAVGCAVTDCRFFNIGKDAVCLQGGSDNRITGNDVTDSAEGGLNVDGSMGNLIAGNHLHHCGQVYKHNGGVTLQNGAGRNVVSGNVVHDLPRYGIALKSAGHENVIEYNRIQNVSLETYDTGAIEVTQQDRNELSGSTIHHNLIGDTIGYSAAGPAACFLSWSIYLDSFAGGYDVHDNICYRNNNGGIMFQGGKGNQVYNNIFVDGRVGQGHLANFMGNFADERLERNIISFTNPQARLFASETLDPKVITVDHNLYWCPTSQDLKTGHNNRPFADWQKEGFDAHSLIADPQFVDPAKDDYTLRPESPAYKLGFQKIDTSQIADPCGCKIVPQGAIFFESPAGK